MKTRKILCLIAVAFIALGAMTGCGEKSEEEQFKENLKNAIDEADMNDLGNTMNGLFN